METAADSAAAVEIVAVTAVAETVADTAVVAVAATVAIAVDTVATSTKSSSNLKGTPGDTPGGFFFLASRRIEPWHVPSVHRPVSSRPL